MEWFAGGSTLTWYTDRETLRNSGEMIVSGRPVTLLAWWGGPFTFDNSGTLSVNGGGIMDLTSGSMTLPQQSGTSLIGGTWKADGTGSSILLKGSNVATIATGATVVLSNNGSINKINSALTNVDGGFYVNGMTFTAGASGLTVGPTGTVGGTGTIAGTVTVSDAGIVAPGNNLGALTVNGALNLSNAAILDFELGDSLVPGASDHLDVTTLSLDGILNITGLSGFGIPAGAGSARYSLISYQTLAANGGLLLGLTPGGPFDYILGYTTGVGLGAGEVFLVIPEPSALAFASLLIGLAANRRPRRD